MLCPHPPCVRRLEHAIGVSIFLRPREPEHQLILGVIVRTLRCNIEDLAAWHPWFFVEPQVVACVAMLARHGGPPAFLDVDCFKSFDGRKISPPLEGAGIF